ncbi:hypothetical protein [Streptomyces sp. NPDC059455]|uniref:hypothetical protein n=1 Tax=Streptomyces sp. NPDC059455 TaxID=3346837 RepID=UPI0036987427
MSDPAYPKPPVHCSKAAPCPQCLRRWRTLVIYRSIFILVAATLVLTVVYGRDTPSNPKPAPSTAAPTNPSPSSPSTTEPTSAPKPTPSMPQDPIGTACNIFDPECSSGTGGTGGTET